MINWIILGLLLVIGSVVLKFEHHSKRVMLVIAIVFGLLLYFSVAAIFNSADADLSSPKGVVKAVYLWAGWVGNAVVDIFDVGKDAVVGIGNAIKVNISEEGLPDGRH